MLKFMIPLLPTLLCMVSCRQEILGQEAQVFYNLYNDSISYVRNGKPVHSLRLHKGEEVRVHLTEFNPFVSEVELKVEETTDDSGSGLNGIAGGSFLPGMPNIFPEMGGGEGGTAIFPTLDLDLPVLTINDSTVLFKSLFDKLKGRGADQMERATQAVQEIEAVIMDISEVQKQLQVNERAMQVSSLALLNVEPLRTQATIKPSLIRKMCQEYYDAIFQKSPGLEVSLNDLLDWQALPARHQLLFENLKSKQNELNFKLGLLEGYTKDLNSNNIADAAFQKLTRDLIDFQVKSKGIRDQLKELTAKPEPPAEMPSIQEMASLQLKLVEVISNDFTYHTTIRPTADAVDLDIRLLRKTAAGDTAQAQVIKNRNLRMEVRGGLKVRASAGLSFGQFFEPAQSYSVSNGNIVGETDGSFTPTLTSFLHFHGYRGQKATLGGTFGAGIPLLGSSEGQSVEFFVGPSLMLGTNQRLVLSLGLKGGQVQRLSKGYQVGDPFDANLGDIPTRGKYELGLFLGASFNLGI